MTPAERERLIHQGMARAQRAMENLDATGLAEIERVYQSAAREIAQVLAERADDGSELTLAQLRGALQQIEWRLSTLSEARDVLVNDGLRVAAELGAQPFLRAEVDVTALLRVPDEAVRFTQAFIGADGLQLSDRLWRIDRGARDAVVNAVERSVVMGQNAAQAAREFLTRGQPVPAEVQGKLNAANATAMGRETTALMVGEGRAGGGAMAQAQRVFRTEINRAHGAAYMKQAEQTPGFRGFQFTLSPAHPNPDVCDEIAARDAFGLGPGVFPNMEEFLKVWPAHPNTLSYPVGIFGKP
ncbi:MAG TPA: hypothetical protein PK225_02340 [Azonexus sp.]|nr:hypothetical protein [Azonexus sp.]